MKKNSEDSSLNKSAKTYQTIYLIGDQNSPKSELYKYLSITQEQQDNELNIYVVQLFSKNSFLYIYDFPKERFLKNYSQIYLTSLPSPIVIFYSISLESTEKELLEWISILNEHKPGVKLIFISEAKSYAERQQIIAKISLVFKNQVVNHILFTHINEDCLENAFLNVNRLGMSIDQDSIKRSGLYIIKNAVKKGISKIKNAFKRLIKKSEEISPI